MVAKATHQTVRASIQHLTQLMNVGQSVADDLRRIGLRSPRELIGRDPWILYCSICARDGQAHDPCLLDVLISAVDYMNGARPRKWWKYTAQRKRQYGAKLRAVAGRYDKSSG
jgi:hypothetical protein